jgi:hypothetical protein
MKSLKIAHDCKNLPKSGEQKVAKTRIKTSGNFSTLEAEAGGL